MDQLANGIASLGFKPQPGGGKVQFLAGDTLVTAAKTSDALSLSAPVSKRLSLVEANDWNQEHLFAKVVIANGATRLQSDLKLKYGVTYASLDAFVRDVVALLPSFSTGSAVTSRVAPATPPAIAPPVASVHKRSANATTEMKTKFGEFSIWVDATKWKETPVKDDPNILQLETANGDAFAKIITEKTAIPKNALRDIAFENARKQDLNIKAVLREERLVNGRRVAVMQLDGVVNNLPIVYYGYYYGGNSGSVQVVCFTLKSSLPEYLDRFTELLDGLEIRDQALPDAQPRSTISKLKLGSQLVLSYNGAKWKQTKETEPGRFSFTLGAGNGYGLVIYEGLFVPLDNLPDIALKNARTADPEAKVISREKMTVNGLTVWRQKMSANIDGIPIFYFGHYFGGEAGTVQVLTYCGQSQFPEYENDLIEFVSGLQLQ